MVDNKSFSRQIENMAIRSLLYEVSASPKPGLVDRHNNGAHNDMDFFTFIDSSTILGETFYECTLMAIEEDYPIEGLLNIIRPIGIKGEKNMFYMTKDVNTHKGLIFSLGIICAACGFLYKRKESITAENICAKVEKMTKNIVNKELMNKKDLTPSTYGEKLYLKYGTTGIRGEVASGFETVRKYALPSLKEMMEKKNLCKNDIFVHVLINLMANTEDSNILGRHNKEVLKVVQNRAKSILEIGGMNTVRGREEIKVFDKWCIENWVSPGGSADLLAVSIMLYLLEDFNEKRKYLK
ncbi:triphosphoribosyl-dephospho-CoA synthase CitG [Anaeromicrobium sediminis]|uniref:Probable 2-(5''-triphosphoribosyl)-3'-dephosphocoenzyme-A synthase n=1 Tax=Anaeromicrobium sediminis TaxID=1478221 RepID=A0A267MGG0_9FIRM|nr:triphosphoribosyl-dephospho-CoA synthase CitG [Anaeromicrobium sediminis]PAB57955.1 triphosphoribosyl-dephospho-CoA synthase CitG [Anaeromicrobium sediminis]